MASYIAHAMTQEVELLQPHRNHPDHATPVTLTVCHLPQPRAKP